MQRAVVLPLSSHVRCVVFHDAATLAWCADDRARTPSSDWVEADPPYPIANDAVSMDRRRRVGTVGFGRCYRSRGAAGRDRGAAQDDGAGGTAKCTARPPVGALCSSGQPLQSRSWRRAGAIALGGAVVQQTQSDGWRGAVSSLPAAANRACRCRDGVNGHVQASPDTRRALTVQSGWWQRALPRALLPAFRAVCAHPVLEHRRAWQPWPGSI